VHLPGGGWRGYDPGHGGAVVNAHVAVAAANAAAIEGSFYRAGASSSLEHELAIRTRP
jgi:hypothetical protein